MHEPHTLNSHFSLSLSHIHTHTHTDSLTAQLTHPLRSHVISKCRERWNCQRSHHRCGVRHELVMKETCDVLLLGLRFWLTAAPAANLCVHELQKCVGGQLEFTQPESRLEILRLEIFDPEKQGRLSHLISILSKGLKQTKTTLKNYRKMCRELIHPHALWWKKLSLREERGRRNQIVGAKCSQISGEV